MKGFEIMSHVKKICKKELIGEKMLEMIKYLGLLALRPTASTSPENSNFSQKLHLSSTKAALDYRMFLSIVDDERKQAKWIDMEGLL